jgi:hypothetical protein
MQFCSARIAPLVSDDPTASAGAWSYILVLAAMLLPLDATRRHRCERVVIPRAPAATMLSAAACSPDVLDNGAPCVAQPHMHGSGGGRLAIPYHRPRPRPPHRANRRRYARVREPVVLLQLWTPPTTAPSRPVWPVTHSTHAGATPPAAPARTSSQWLAHCPSRPRRRDVAT